MENCGYGRKKMDAIKWIFGMIISIPLVAVMLFCLRNLVKDINRKK